MRLKPKKKCNEMGCRTLIDFDIPKGYCDDHKNASGSLYDRFRLETDGDYIRFYSTKAWKDVRRQAMIRDGWICQECIKSGLFIEATVGDHVIPTKVDWDRRLDITNIRSLCFACHNTKTAQENRK